jgi:hypothetical protein
VRHGPGGEDSLPFALIDAALLYAAPGHHYVVRHSSQRQDYHLAFKVVRHVLTCRPLGGMAGGGACVPFVEGSESRGWAGGGSAGPIGRWTAAARRGGCCRRERAWCC